MKTNSLAFRLVAGPAIWIAGILVIGGISLSLLFQNYVQRSFEDRLTVFLETLIQATVEERDELLVIWPTLGEVAFVEENSGWYWQINSPGGPVERSVSLADGAIELDQTTRLDKDRFNEALGAGGRMLMVIERDDVLPESGTPHRFAVAVDRAIMAAEAKPFDTTLVVSLLLLAVGSVAALLIQVRYGLRPLRTMQRALVDIRHGRADKLEGRFPSEVDGLAGELNSLITHDAEVVERARRHVGNLAHALKTPLTVLTNEAAPDNRHLPDIVLRQSDIMRRHVDHYLSRARTAAATRVLGARTEIRPVVEGLVRTLTRIHADRGISVEPVLPEGLYFRGERQDLEELLGNLMDNACKWARAEVRVTAEPSDGRVRLVIDDDGPGLPAERRQEALGRGKRLDEATPGSGLGLSIVQDIAGLYGGGIELADSPLGGLRALLDLPAAEAPDD